MAEKYSRLSGC